MDPGQLAGFTSCEVWERRNNSETVTRPWFLFEEGTQSFLREREPLYSFFFPGVENMRDDKWSTKRCLMEDSRAELDPRKIGFSNGIEHLNAEIRRRNRGGAFSGIVSSMGPVSWDTKMTTQLAGLISTLSRYSNGGNWMMQRLYDGIRKHSVIYPIDDSNIAWRDRDWDYNNLGEYNGFGNSKLFLAILYSGSPFLHAIGYFNPRTAQILMRFFWVGEA